MRLALAAVALLVLTYPALAVEAYVCTNHGRTYPLLFDRDAGSLTINGEKAKIENTDIASGIVDVRGTIDLGNMFFWANLNNEPSIEWMKDQKITRIDHCRYINRPAG